MTALGYECIGGENSPYIWVDGKMDSWKFFDRLLEQANVVCTPGGLRPLRRRLHSDQRLQPPREGAGGDGTHPQDAQRLRGRGSAP
jgi:hypothetical protein